MTFRDSVTSIFFSALVVAALLSSQLAAQLSITEVASTSGAPDPPLVGLDWWELTNAGPTAIDLAGYTWEDNSYPSGDNAVFPAVTIGPGESVIIHENDFANPALVDAFRTTWGLSSSVQILDQPLFTGPNTFSGLSSGGDEVNVADPAGNLVASVSFPASTSGVTFEWGTNGADLGLSVNGENGAYLSSYGGVGSPGTAVVPEPHCIALLLMGLTLCSSVRRRG